MPGLAAPDGARAGADLTELSLDQLLDIRVTAVSKRPEAQDRAAAAVFVLSGEDIRRAGVRTLPEALRMIPGMQVVRIDSQNWGVTARGFSGGLADKLEVVMDGRSLYTPLFSGVFWDAQDTFIQDIDRIEVIRGPGASVWGANAVNGVVNIVTKPAAETTGLLFNAGGGSEYESFGGLRAGGRLGDRGHIRAYAKAANFGDSLQVDRVPPGAGPSEQSGEDAWQRSQAGFRADWLAFGSDQFTAQGDIYDGELDQRISALNPAARAEDFSGHNVITRWSRSLSATSGLQLQAYYDHSERRDPGTYAEQRDTYDIQLQHHFNLGPRHALTWGLGYRRSEDEVDNLMPAAFRFDPARRTLTTWSLFAQDQLSLASDALRLTLGVKLEHNDFTGTEVQPSLRASWQLRPGHNLWAAVSRAVRTPNRLDDDIRAFTGQGPSGFISGNPAFESETVLAWETGYRVRLSERVSLGVSLYFNDYDKLRGVDNTATPDALIDNQLSGETYGGELNLGWQLRDNLRLHAGYGYLDLTLDLLPGATDTVSAALGDNQNDPRHQGFVRGIWEVSNTVYVSGMLRYVDSLPGQGEFDALGRPVGLDSYTELDLRAAWTPFEGVELAVSGRNLLHDAHPEYGRGASIYEIERALYGELTWRY